MKAKNYKPKGLPFLALEITKVSIGGLKKPISQELKAGKILLSSLAVKEFCMVNFEKNSSYHPNILLKSLNFDVENSHFCSSLTTQHKESADFTTMGTPRVEAHFGQQDMSKAAYIEDDLDDYFMKVTLSINKTDLGQDFIHIVDSLGV